MAQVELAAVTKRFGDVEVLKPIDLTIRDRELLVLLGPSGCGKSTTLRIIAGLEQPTAGKVSIGGKDVTNLPPKARDIAMVFQSYALYPHLSVKENLAFGLKVRGAPKAEIAERVGAAAAMLGLESLLDRKPKALSGGQRQRVAMGRAIVRRPQVFLFDEPLSNLDAALRTQMRAEIARLHQQLGITTIYVTHDQVEAMTLATRIVILDRGVVQQAGPPLEVYAQPKNGFVARFLGAPSMNQIAGKISDGVFEAPGLTVPLGPRGRSLSGQRIVLGFRPQSLRPAEPGMVRGEVELVEPTGGESFVRLRLDPTTHVTARLEGAVRLAIGAKLAFDLSLDDLHLFRSTDSGDAGEAIG